MNKIDKTAFKLGLVAAAVAAVLPVLVQAAVTVAPLAAGIA